jgi:hypothetical protein
VNSKWPDDTVALLAKRVNGTATGQDHVDWATNALMEGFDSPSLAILAGLDLEGSVSQFEAEMYFQKVVEELRWQLPDDETLLRRHLVEIAEQIKAGAIDTETGIERIHREIVSPLAHPKDLLPWCLLWEGNLPDGTGTLPEEERISTILQFTDNWLSGKNEDTINR